MTKCQKKVFWTPTLHGIIVPLPARKELGVQQTSENIKEQYPQHNRGVIFCVALLNSSKQDTNKGFQAITAFDFSEKGKDKPTKKFTCQIQTTTPHSISSNSQSQKQQLHKLLQKRKLRGSPTAADALGLPYSWFSLQVGYSGGPHA